MEARQLRLIPWWIISGTLGSAVGVVLAVAIDLRPVNVMWAALLLGAWVAVVHVSVVHRNWWGLAVLLYATWYFSSTAHILSQILSRLGWGPGWDI